MNVADLFIECLKSNNLSEIKMIVIKQIKLTNGLSMKDVERIKIELKKISATENKAMKKESVLLLRRLSFNYRRAIGFSDARKTS